MNRQILIAAALSAISVAAFAGQTATDGDGNHAAAASTASESTVPTFKTIDQNHDGQISKSEADAVPSLAKGFDAADKNKDGKLSQSEYNAAMSVHRGS